VGDLALVRFRGSRGQDLLAIGFAHDFGWYPAFERGSSGGDSRWQIPIGGVRASHLTSYRGHVDADGAEKNGGITVTANIARAARRQGLARQPRSRARYARPGLLRGRVRH
jgi:hypothetical protein